MYCVPEPIAYRRQRPSCIAHRLSAVHVFRVQTPEFQSFEIHTNNLHIYHLPFISLIRNVLKMFLCIRAIYESSSVQIIIKNQYRVWKQEPLRLMTQDLPIWKNLFERCYYILLCIIIIFDKRETFPSIYLSMHINVTETNIRLCHWHWWKACISMKVTE